MESKPLGRNYDWKSRAVNEKIFIFPTQPKMSYNFLRIGCKSVELTLRLHAENFEKTSVNSHCNSVFMKLNRGGPTTQSTIGRAWGPRRNSHVSLSISNFFFLRKLEPVLITSTFHPLKTTSLASLDSALSTCMRVLKYDVHGVNSSVSL